MILEKIKFGIAKKGWEPLICTFTVIFNISCDIFYWCNNIVHCF